MNGLNETNNMNTMDNDDKKPTLNDLKTVDFDYDLPQELIATTPTQNRDDSRLLVVNNENQFIDTHFNNLLEYINPDDLLIVNDSQVLKARIFGKRHSGGAVELLVENIIDQTHFTAYAKSNKPIRYDSSIFLDHDEIKLNVIENQDGLFKFASNKPLDLLEYLEKYGHVPLPPYMKRQDTQSDIERYQTVYAKEKGSIAAPTAGLHFTDSLLEKLRQKGVKIAPVTLHVGAGTFKGVTSEYISMHKMHSENYFVPHETIELIKHTKASGNKVIAVGTTSLRTLETIANNGYQSGFGSTNIFITPGYEFKVVDKLITNFHVPKSTLLMLVCAFSGSTQIKAAYAHAISQRYRFFSYGDAMLLTRNKDI